MGKNRRSFSDEFKANVVRQYLGEKVQVSDLAAELEVQQLDPFIPIPSPSSVVVHLQPPGGHGAGTKVEWPFFSLE